VETVYFGDARPDSVFLLTAVDPPTLSWSGATPLTPKTSEYVSKLPALPADDEVARLRYFLKYLEHEEDLIKQDTYDEFARAPLATVRQLKDDFDRDQLKKWIQDKKVVASRRRLYLTMLAVCGSPDDLAIFESIITSRDPEERKALDAAINGYLAIKGPAGLALIDDAYFTNKDAAYPDILSAVMAIRVHGEEFDVVPKSELVKSFRHLLDHADFADLVIADLARWGDWDSTERLVALFKNSDPEKSWARVPIINFLRASPEPRAKEFLVELARIDPKSMERASLFAIPAPAIAPTTAARTDQTTAEPTTESSATTSDATSSTTAAPAPNTTSSSHAKDPKANDLAQSSTGGDGKGTTQAKGPAADDSSTTKSVAASKLATAKEPADASAQAAYPVSWVVAFPIVAVVLLMGLIWSVLAMGGGRNA
jgi:hypothetical protein